MKPCKVRTPLSHFFASSRVYYEPFGTVLIISPWNYPVNLTLSPLAGAIAAGNCAVLKPSDSAPHTAQVLADLVADTFDPQFVSMVPGGRAENTHLLDQQFDYIFFTGGVTVGTLVMQAAARHLTPVTLELGGKSPCIVDETADVQAAAKRIIFGKLLNGGQTCVAPDHIYCPKDLQDEFLYFSDDNLSIENTQTLKKYMDFLKYSETLHAINLYLDMLSDLVEIKEIKYLKKSINNFEIDLYNDGVKKAKQEIIKYYTYPKNQKVKEKLNIFLPIFENKIILNKKIIEETKSNYLDINNFNENDINLFIIDGITKGIKIC